MSNNSSRVEENMRLMKTLDDAWNSQDWDTFSKRHTDDVVVRWPDQPPTNGIDAHKKGESISSKRFLTIMSRTIRTRHYLVREIGLVL